MFAVGLLVAYTSGMPTGLLNHLFDMTYASIYAAMVILYTVAPLLYRMASSAYFNLSLLSSDFYGLLFGLFLYVNGPITIKALYKLIVGLQHYRPYWLYFLSFVVILSGLITYFWHSRRKCLVSFRIRLNFLSMIYS